MESDQQTPHSEQTVKIVALVSGAHFFSHFYLLLLPPLFPLLHTALDVSYVQLGIALTMFGVTTALLQPPVGFLVDRFGGGKILIAALLLQSLAIAAMGINGSYLGLLIFMGILGIGNAVYHPADYAILSNAIAGKVIGRVFSYHTFAGFVGSALAPITIVYMSSIINWRTALVICSLPGFVAALYLSLHIGALSPPRTEPDSVNHEPKQFANSVKMLLSKPVLMGVLFFFCIQLGGDGIGAFGVSVLTNGYAMSLTAAATLLTAYLFASPIGVLLGGLVADRIERHDYLAAACMLSVTVLICLLAGFRFSVIEMALLLGFAGLLSGVVTPSRDKLIWSMSDPRDAGKVFGFVTSGFTLASVAAPLYYGMLLDVVPPRWVFWSSAFFAMATACTVLATGHLRRDQNA